MNTFVTNTNKLAYGAKALGLLLLSVFLTQILWSNVAFTGFAQISKPSTSLAYVQLGASTFTTMILGHFMFVLSMFLFGSKQEFVMKQLLAFSGGHILTLWLGMLNLITPSSYIIHALVPLTTVYIAGENMFAQKLKDPRVIAVFFCGLIHGFGMSASLHEAGLESFNPKLIGMYNIGIELAITCLAIPAFLILSKLASGKSFSRPFFKIVSVILVIASAYFVIKQAVLAN